MLSPEGLSFINIVRLLTCSGTVDGVQHLWFIPYILCCYFITPYLNGIKDRIKEKGNVVVLGAFVLISIGCILYWGLFGSFFRADSIICYIAGYFIAIVVEKSQERIPKGLIVISSAIAIPMCAVRIVVEIIEHSFTRFYDILMNYFIQYSKVAFGIWLFIVLYALLGRLERHSYLDLSDKYAYYIYLTHHFFIIGPLSLLRIIPIAGINIIVVLLCTIITAFIIQRVSNRIFISAKT